MIGQHTNPTRQRGPRWRVGLVWFQVTPAPAPLLLPSRAAAAVAFSKALPEFEPWSRIVERDLSQTADIRVEVIDTREGAERLIRQRRRAAILVFGPRFSEQ